MSRRSPSTSAPVVIGGVAYHVVAHDDLRNPRFTATSARTGATLWTVALPGNTDHATGLSVAGQRVIVPFNRASYTDGSQVFVWGSSKNITTYRLTLDALPLPCAAGSNPAGGTTSVRSGASSSGGRPSARGDRRDAERRFYPRGQ